MVRKVKLIYNPASGNTSFRNKLDYLIEKFQQCGLQIVPCRTLCKEDIPMALREVQAEAYYAIVVAGGDGTVHDAVNAMAAAGIDIPLAIIPAGTANDFAAHLNMPSTLDQLSIMVAAGNYREIDLGKANDRYFINVASAGLLTDVSHTIGLHFKNLFGKLAYYLKGLEQLPNFQPIPLRIDSEEYCGDEELYLFLVLNGSYAGGFRLVVPAQVDDGMLDVIAIRRCSLPYLVSLMFKLARGGGLQDSQVLYFQTKAVAFRSSIALTSDLDGEKGPLLPLQIEVCPRKLKVFFQEEKPREVF